ncbi:RimK family alpha-L-glutamate ligase [Thermodesulfobacteriota bacterium]
MKIKRAAQYSFYQMSEKQMILSFHPCFTADQQVIFYSRRKINEDDILLIQNAELIILSQACSEELYKLCEESGADIFPDYRTRFRYPGKTGQSILIEEAGIDHPVTYAWNSVKEFLSKFDESYYHEYPFILKADKTHEGEGIFLIKKKADLNSALDELEKKRDKFVSQEYISSHGNVLRVVIMGENYISYWKRPGDSGSEITSMKEGAVVDKEWKPELQEKGREAAKRLSDKTGINLAAVDFIFNIDGKDPKALMLEINYYFGRHGLGGTINYYKMLYHALIRWMEERGYDSKKIALV